MTVRTALFVCGMALILATLASGLKAAERISADPTAVASVFDFGSRIDDNGARGK